MFSKSTDVQETPTTERFIDLIVERVPICEKHPYFIDDVKIKDQPCYLLPLDSQSNRGRLYNWGVCDWRARKAGFVGEESTPKPKQKFHSQWNRSANS